MNKYRLHFSSKTRLLPTATAPRLRYYNSAICQYGKHTSRGVTGFWQYQWWEPREPVLQPSKPTYCLFWSPNSLFTITVARKFYRFKSAFFMRFYSLMFFHFSFLAGFPSTSNYSRSSSSGSAPNPSQFPDPSSYGTTYRTRAPTQPSGPHQSGSSTHSSGTSVVKYFCNLTYNYLFIFFLNHQAVFHICTSERHFAL